MVIKTDRQTERQRQRQTDKQTDTKTETGREHTKRPCNAEHGNWAETKGKPLHT